ncbi:unnamed protein product [Gadus morhua 'NCC']
MSRFNNHGVRDHSYPASGGCTVAVTPQQPTQLEPSSNKKIFHNMSQDVRRQFLTAQTMGATRCCVWCACRWSGSRAASLARPEPVTPLLQSLNPQIEAANDYACSGLDQLEKNFPVLQQSSEEVMGHLKDALLLTGWSDVLGALQDSPLGRAAYSGLDEVLSQLEDASAYYLPLPPTMRLEWERRVQEFEEQDEGEEPGLWTRFRGLLLRLSLQLYHRLQRQRDALTTVAQGLKDRAARTINRPPPNPTSTSTSTTTPTTT